MFVPIGGIDQWITIHGNSGSNPVVLFLHPGPGVPLSPYEDALYSAWEQDFTLVQWDQRGAGRTYGKNPPSGPISIEQMVDDGVEVAEFLTRRLNTAKIILIGVSWGSILGMQMAHRRPDLFYAYIGQSQVITLMDQSGDADSYARSLAAARAAGDQRSVDAMIQSQPPWRSGAQWRAYQTVAGPYEVARVTAPPAPMPVSAAYSGAEDRAQNAAGMSFSLDNFFGTTELGPLFRFDLTKLGADFRIPIFLVEGEQDALTSPVTARAYFDAVTAREKHFLLIPGAGHGPSLPQLTLTREILEDVRHRLIPAVRRA